MSDIVILPYTTLDGIPTFNDSFLSSLYHKVHDQGIDQSLFHDGSIRSVSEWLRYVKSPTVLFYVVLYQDSVVGFFWLNRIEQTHAYIHFTTFKEVWGTTVPVAVGRQSLRMLLSTQDSSGSYIWHTIMGMTPAANKIALKYIQACGMKLIGEVPNLLWSAKHNQPVSGYLSYATRKEVFDEDIQ